MLLSLGHGVFSLGVHLGYGQVRRDANVPVPFNQPIAQHPQPAISLACKRRCCLIISKTRMSSQLVLWYSPSCRMMITDSDNGQFRATRSGAS